MKRDVLYAMTDDGVKLPIIDVTHPAFAVTATDGDLAAMSEQFVLESNQRQEMPASLRDALSRSVLGQALMAASGSFLSGVSTYLFKLGPDNLWGDAQPIDRRIAASFPALTSRVRLQDMARLLADGLMLSINVEPHRPVCLVNIAGGTAADTWNAMIRLQQSNVLMGREIIAAILDIDDRGPGFGMRALAALRAEGAPLSGLDIACRYIRYEWADPEQLRQALEDLQAVDAACGVSSEGGLFEYGSDAEIAANLEALYAGTAPDATVVGSVTRDGEPVRASQGATRLAARPRTIEGFRHLVEPAGWIVDEVIERPFSYHVRLAKSGRGRC